MSRWDGLFSDLEAQADALHAAERAAEVEERARIELAGTTLHDRLRAAVGQRLRLTCAGQLRLTGVLVRVGSGWLLMDEGGGRECVAREAALVCVSGLSRVTAPPDSAPVVESRLGVSHALRGIARDRSGVRMHLVDGSVLVGTVDRAGRDFAEVALHPPAEPRRVGAVRDVVAVAFSAIAAVRREV